MKVKLLTDRATADGEIQSAGDVVNVPTEEARVLLERGSAEPVGEKPERRRETRVLAGGEER